MKFWQEEAGEVHFSILYLTQDIQNKIIQHALNRQLLLNYFTLKIFFCARSLGPRASQFTPGTFHMLREAWGPAGAFHILAVVVAQLMVEFQTLEWERV